MPHQDDHAGHGFCHDFPNLLGRRRFLTVLSGLGLSATAGLPATALDCVAMPRETAGPFPVDGTNRRAGQIGDIYQSDQGRYAQSIRNLAGIPLSRDSIFCDNSAAELLQ